MRVTLNRFLQATATASTAFLVCLFLVSTVHVNADDGFNPWSCPDSEVWLKCGELHSDLDYYGYPRVTNHYGSVEVHEPHTKRHLDQCGRGYIVRTWKIKYHYDWYTCKQHIYVGEQSGYGGGAFDPGYHMTWPKDYDMTSCQGTMHPDEMPSGHNWPRMRSNYHGCSKVGINHKDELRPYISHGHGSGYSHQKKPCKVIHRVWEIIDWCQYDTKNWYSHQGKRVYHGQWFYTQKIYLYDEEAPTISNCPADTTVSTGDCDGKKVWLELPKLEAMDNCGDVWVSYSKKLLHGEYGSGSGLQHGGADASGYYEPGTTEVTYKVLDACGNLDECTFLVTVEAKDTKAPAVIGISSLTVTLMMSDTSEGMIELNPVAFNSSSSDNCTAEKDLLFSVEPNMLTCENFGSNDVKFIVEDEAGNTSYIVVEVIVQSGSAFSCMGGAVSGSVTDLNGVGLSDVEISLMDRVENKMTNEHGLFDFSNFPLGHNLHVSAVKNSEEVLDHVDMFDYTLLALHVDGVREITDPYRLIAADIDGNKVIDQEDVWALQRVIAGIDLQFPQDRTWTFMTDMAMSDTLSVFEMELEDTYHQPAYSGEEQLFNFHAIKIGDIGKAPVVDPTDETDIQLIGNDQLLEADEQAEVSIRMKDKAVVTFLEIPISVGGAMQVEDVTSELLQSSGHFSVIKRADGSAVVGWYSDQALTLPQGAEILQVNVQVAKKALIHSAITIESERTSLEWEPSEELSAAQNGNRLMQNAPNPFVKETQIEFYLEFAGQAALRVADINGRLLYQSESNYSAGLHTIRIPAHQLPQSGVMMYSLETSDEVLVKKMIKVQN